MGLGGLHQLLLVQLADLGLQGEGCHSANAGHCLCCCLVGLVEQLASLIKHLHNLEAKTQSDEPQKAGAKPCMKVCSINKGTVTQRTCFHACIPSVAHKTSSPDKCDRVQCKQELLCAARHMHAHSQTRFENAIWM